MKIETKQENAKELAKRYNSKIAPHICNIAYWELVELFKKSKFPYVGSSITVMIRDAKLKYDKGIYNALSEPIHWSYFYNMLEWLSKNNNRSRNVSGNTKVVEVKPITKTNTEKTTDYSVLKELIKKEVSDEVVLKLFPNLK